MEVAEAGSGWEVVLKKGEATSSAINTVTAAMTGLPTSMLEAKDDLSAAKTDPGRARQRLKHHPTNWRRLSNADARQNREQECFPSCLSDPKRFENAQGLLTSNILSVMTDVLSRTNRPTDRFSATADELTVDHSAGLTRKRRARDPIGMIRSAPDHFDATQIQVRRISAKVFGPEDAH